MRMNALICGKYTCRDKAERKADLQDSNIQEPRGLILKKGRKLLKKSEVKQLTRREEVSVLGMESIFTM